MKAGRQGNVLLYSVAALSSLLLSCWLNYSETVINPDAICYLLSAQAIPTLGIKGSMQLCGQAQWPFYSVLIYGVAQVTHLSYLMAAYVCNGFFSLITVLVFILIVRELGGTKRTLWLAAGVILLAHHLNGVREFIIRDHGFWAFYLLSLWCFLRYFQRPRFKMAFAFSASLLVATLFRIEGSVFLLGLPLLAWCDSRYTFYERLKHFISLNFLLIILVVIGCIGLLAHPQAIVKLSRLGELSHQWQHGFVIMSERYLSMKAALAQYVLTLDSVNDAGLVWLMMMVGWYGASVVLNLSWIYSVLVVYAWCSARIRFAAPAEWVLGSYILINVLITFCFLVQRVFLSNRYLLALSLVLMLWVPFALNDLIERWANHLRYRVSAVLALLFILMTSLGGIFNFGYSKSYLHTGGHWLAAHVPANASLYVNDIQLMYYSQHFGNTIFSKMRNEAGLEAIAQGKWKHYDYLAFRLKHKQQDQWAAVLKEIPMLPIAEFHNKRGDRVVIYKTVLRQ